MAGYRFLKGKDNPNWKGDAVGYQGIHGWISRKYGKANHCEVNSSHIGKRFDWANISGNYRRDRKDWRMLCVPCHKKYDIQRLGIVAWNKGTKGIMKVNSGSFKKGHILGNRFQKGKPSWNKGIRSNKYVEERICLICSKKFLFNNMPSVDKRRGKFCSNSCSTVMRNRIKYRKNDLQLT